MDRNKLDQAAKSQARFMEFLCLPLYEVWHVFSNDSLLQHIEANIEYWNDMDLSGERLHRHASIVVDDHRADVHWVFCDDVDAGGTVTADDMHEAMPSSRNFTRRSLHMSRLVNAQSNRTGMSATNSSITGSSCVDVTVSESVLCSSLLPHA